MKSLNAVALVELSELRRDYGAFSSVDQGFLGFLRLGSAPKWEYGVTSVWLWLEWVRVERRGIVLHIEIVQPIEVA